MSRNPASSMLVELIACLDDALGRLCKCRVNWLGGRHLIRLRRVQLRIRLVLNRIDFSLFIPGTKVRCVNSLPPVSIPSALQLHSSSETSPR